MKTTDNLNRTKVIQFNTFGYYFIGLVILTFLGFWPTYFSKFIDGTANFNIYFHFHAIMASLWIALLITQPILIRKKKLAIHKKIGKLSFIILPLFFLSVILLKHHRIGGYLTENLGASLWLQTKDLVIIGIMYAIAIANKRNMQVHARAMIATGIVFIEPTLGRFLGITALPNINFLTVFLLTIGITYALLIFFIYLERKQTTGRWIFPLEIFMYAIFHYLYIYQISFPFWDSFAKWFALLPIT